MPELPEVEAVARKLRREAVGATIASVEVFRARAIHPQNLAELEKAQGHTIEKVERRGKHIVLWLKERGVIAAAVRVHLGMTGNFHVIPDARLYTSSVRVLLRLKGGRGLVLEDPRIFGNVQFYTPDALETRLAGIGIDPLTKKFSRDFFLSVAAVSRKPAKVFLMEQKLISGLGNIYSAEALFQARIDPLRALSSISNAKLVALWQAIPAVLKRAIKHTVQSYSQPGFLEDMDYFVYGRKDEACRVCGRTIQRVQQAGRSTYYCPNCQK